MPDISLGDARRLGVRILTRHKVSEKNAAPTVESLLRAEMEGIPSHGFPITWARQIRARWTAMPSPP